MNPHEEWRPIRGYEGRYEVSSLGRVRSLPRKYCPASRNLHAAVASTWRVGADHRLAFANWRDYVPRFES